MTPAADFVLASCLYLQQERRMHGDCLQALGFRLKCKCQDQVVSPIQGLESFPFCRKTMAFQDVIMSLTWYTDSS